MDTDADALQLFRMWWHFSPESSQNNFQAEILHAPYHVSLGSGNFKNKKDWLEGCWWLCRLRRQRDLASNYRSKALQLFILSLTFVSKMPCQDWNSSNLLDDLNRQAQRPVFLLFVRLKLDDNSSFCCCQSLDGI